MLTKNKWIYILILLIVLFLIFYFFRENIINILINLNTSNPLVFSIYILTCLIYFITPMPVTIIILLNGYLFGQNGFFISIILVFIASLILYLLAKYIKNKFNIYSFKMINLKKINFEAISNNNYSIFFSRYVFPFFFHNVYYGLSKNNIIKFMLIITMAEIPLVYAINLLGGTIKEFQASIKIQDYNIFFDLNFYIPFVIILIIFVLSNFFFKQK